MDKVHVALAVLKKHHFWALCAVVLVLAFGGWYKATGDLTTQFNQRKTKLEKLRTNLVSITGEANHPNEEFIKATQEKHVGLKKVVLAAGSRLYDQQKAQNTLPTVLSAGFKEQFNERATLVGDQAKGEMDPQYRDEYLYHIHKHFPTLFKIIERREQVVDETEPAAKPAVGAGGERPAARGGPRDKEAPPVKMTGIVDWDKGDADRTIDRFSRWRTTPSTLDVLLAQEDLWVYEAILRVIRNTNNLSPDPSKYDPPKDRRTTAIKRIISLQIGQEAAEGWQKGESRAATAPAAATPPMVGGHAPMAAAGPGGAASKPEGPSPLAGRYVDDKGQPLTDPKQQPYAEFRMMPVTMRIMIEQKAIPKVLAECANSNMPIEVRSFRLSLTPNTPLDAVGGGDREPRGPVPGGQPLGVPPVAGGAARPRGGEATVTSETDDSEWANRYEPPVPLEIQGIIYIYNEPDLSKVGTGTAGGGAPPEPVPAAAPPAATPGPATPTPTPAPATPVPAAPAPKGGQP